jgi:hypothetical protein
VLPVAETIECHARRLIEQQFANKAMEEIMPEIKKQAASATLPADLRRFVEAELARRPELPGRACETAGAPMGCRRVRCGAKSRCKRMSLHLELLRACDKASQRSVAFNQPSAPDEGAPCRWAIISMTSCMRRSSSVV